MLVLAIVAFSNAWFKGDFMPTKFTVVAFFIDFFIRVLINPRFAPTLIMARWMVNNQTAEYVGAPQKRFAWGIGLGLASLMMFLVVLQDVRGPINMIICLICLTLLFLETSFGICIGCKLYNVFNKEKAQLCPGNVCAIQNRDGVAHTSADCCGLCGNAACLVTHPSRRNTTAGQHQPGARRALPCSRVRQENGT